MTSPAYVHPSAVVEPTVRLADEVKVWHFCHVCAGAVLGQGVVLGQNGYVAENVKIGPGSHIQNNVSLYSGVELEAEVFIGPSVVFTNVLHPRAFVSRRDFYVPTLVRRGASIGANATIVAGITIGRYALIGAGSVVTRDVRDHELVVGVPARHHGWVSRHGEALDFIESRARCPATGAEYELRATGVLELNGE